MRGCGARTIGRKRQASGVHAEVWRDGRRANGAQRAANTSRGHATFIGSERTRYIRRHERARNDSNGPGRERVGPGRGESAKERAAAMMQRRCARLRASRGGRSVRDAG